MTTERAPEPASTASIPLRAEPQDAGARITLARVLNDLGSTMLNWVVGPSDDVTVSDRIVIYDAGDGALLDERAIVLAVGVHGDDELPALVERSRAAGVAALVVRGASTLSPEVLDDAAANGPVILDFAPGATWHQLVTVLGSILRPPDATTLAPPEIGGVPTGDLFGLANAICALIDAPVTIEDLSSKVLAFSDRQDEADFIRIECILGRRTPEEYARIEEASGAHGVIRRATEPIFFDPMKLPGHGKARGRVVVPIRAGDELLGTIWGVVDQPLSPERSQLLLESSRLVALHMLHYRTGGDLAQRLVNDLVTSALEGAANASGALAQLGLSDSPCIVVALARSDLPPGDRDAAVLAERAARLQRLADAFGLHLAIHQPRTRVAVLGGTVYAIVPSAAGGGAERRLLTTCQTFVERTSRETPLVAAVGRSGSGAKGVADSRLDADRALRVLRHSELSSKVVEAADLEVDALLLDLKDMATASGSRPSGAYARLLEYDANRNGFMLETLRAWLDAHGEIGMASAMAHVHQNTFRYRLRRIGEVGSFDLADPRERLALLLQFQIFPPAEWLDRLKSGDDQ